jgi:hypothetical protein
MPLFTVAEARDFDKRQLANAATYPDEAIEEGEARIAEDFARICCVAFAPTTVTAAILDAARGDTLWLPPRTTAVTAAAYRAVGGTEWTALTADELLTLEYDAAGFVRWPGHAWPAGAGVVRATYTHGYATVPGPVKRAALLVLVDQLVPSNLDPRATAQVNELGSFRLSVAGGRLGGQRNWYGIPEVDRVLNDFRECSPGVG